MKLISFLLFTFIFMIVSCREPQTYKPYTINSTSTDTEKMTVGITIPQFVVESGDTICNWDPDKYAEFPDLNEYAQRIKIENVSIDSVKATPRAAAFYIKSRNFKDKGSVRVSFVVNEIGVACRSRVEKTSVFETAKIDPATARQMEEIALKITNSQPNYVPGVVNGKLAKVRLYLMFYFN